MEEESVQFDLTGIRSAWDEPKRPHVVEWMDRSPSGWTSTLSDLACMRICGLICTFCSRDSQIGAQPPSYATQEPVTLALCYSLPHLPVGLCGGEGKHVHLIITANS